MTHIDNASPFFSHLNVGDRILQVRVNRDASELRVAVSDLLFQFNGKDFNAAELTRFMTAAVAANDVSVCKRNRNAHHTRVAAHMNTTNGPSHGK